MNKKMRVFNVILLLICFQMNSSGDRLRHKYVQELISYTVKTEKMTSRPDVYISSKEDSLHYCLKIYFDSHCGCNGCAGRKLHYLTADKNPFFKADKHIVPKLPDGDDFLEIRFCLHKKDMSFCPMFSYYKTPGNSITGLTEFLNIRSEILQEDLDYDYPAYQVEYPPSPVNEDEVLEIQKKYSDQHGCRNFYCVFLIGKDGSNAAFSYMSEDPDSLKKARFKFEDFVKDMENCRFNPAFHHGVAVKSFYVVKLRL